LVEKAMSTGHGECCGSGDDPLLGVGYLCFDKAFASLRLHGLAGKFVLHTEQDRRQVLDRQGAGHGRLARQVEQEAEQVIEDCCHGATVRDSRRPDVAVIEDM
jgi:hypothetical protein